MKELHNLLEKKIEGIRDIRDESNEKVLEFPLIYEMVLNLKQLRDNYIRIHKLKAHLDLIHLQLLMVNLKHVI